jgi:hypothetical protein
MKVTSIDASVLGGQGSIGSGVLAVQNAAPGLGPKAGDPGNDQVSVSITNPGDENYSSEAVEPLPSHLSEGVPPIAAPAPSAAQTDGGPSNEPMSQYSTIGPIPKG